MKKTVLPLICCAFLIFLCGCQKELSGGAPDIVTNFESGAVIKDGEKIYECKIIHTPEETNNITFTSPKNLEGLTFLCEGGKYTVSMKNLSGEFSTEPLSDDSAFLKIIKILNSLNNKENVTSVSKEEGEKILKGNLENTEYEITLNKNGVIKRLNVPKNNLSVEFSQE